MKSLYLFLILAFSSIANPSISQDDNISNPIITYSLNDSVESEISPYLQENYLTIREMAVRTFLENYVLICDSKSSYAYHKYECRGLQNCTHEILKITESEAIKRGRSACKNCY